MISVLLVFVLFGVLQVAGLFFVRSIVASAASDGARFSASVGVDPATGGQRADLLIGQALGTRAAKRIHCQGRAEPDPASGLTMSVVTCTGTMPSIFLPIGALVELHVQAESLQERP